MAAVGELIDVVEMDVTGRRYADVEELVQYCRCVAGSIGRLCLGVFGGRPDPHAASYADLGGSNAGCASVLTPDRLGSPATGNVPRRLNARGRPSGTSSSESEVVVE